MAIEQRWKTFSMTVVAKVIPRRDIPDKYIHSRYSLRFQIYRVSCKPLYLYYRDILTTSKNESIVEP